MRPAFSSPREATAFAALLALLLLLPVLVGRTGWLDRRDVYSAAPLKYGAYPWMGHKIFDQTNEADIVFVGSSHIWADIDTPYVQKKLGEQLGREPDVFTLGWMWSGYDTLYIVARDLLEQRHVRMLVIYDEYHYPDTSHPQAPRWFRVGENSEAFRGLPWKSQVSLYGGAVLGLPRHLLSRARSNQIGDLTQGTNYLSAFYGAPNLAGQRGALRVRLSYGQQPHFALYNPEVLATPEDAVVYSAETRDAFSFTGPGTSAFHLHFARKLARLCQERGTRLVVLHLPEITEHEKTTIPERERWPELWNAPVDIVGIPGAKLFAGLSQPDLAKLFYDPGHLNQNGQDLFTPLVTPVLLRLYAASTNRF